MVLGRNFLLNGFVFGLTLASLAVLWPDHVVAKPKPLGCPPLYSNHYIKGRMHKAFATTGGRSIRAYSTACAYAVGYGSK
jgi:hypothetical protein